jgi:hypothetical protein
MANEMNTTTTTTEEMNIDKTTAEEREQVLAYCAEGAIMANETNTTIITEEMNTDKTNGSGAALHVQQDEFIDGKPPDTDRTDGKKSGSERVDGKTEASIGDEAVKKSGPELVSKEELDAEEEEFRALRRDVPGVKGASTAGMLTIAVGKEPMPKHSFFRTHKDFMPVVALVNVEVGMDRRYVAVMPHMIEPLAAMGITAADHVLYLTITSDGGLRIVPVRGPNEDGEQNDWDRTKEAALIEGMDGWVRMYSDMPNHARKCFPAPAGQFGEPNWPHPFKPAQIMKLAFKDKGNLISSLDHILVQKWAGRDPGTNKAGKPGKKS